MMYDAILFDLDGTLLPMDMDTFTKGYITLLANYAEPLGYKKEEMSAALWKAVVAMVKNDGSHRNKDVFWDVFGQNLGNHVYADISAFDTFYRTGFHKAKALTGKNTQAKATVALAREKAKKVILATNPLFPAVGLETRLSWIGLKLSDFDLVTDYENSSYCKPNPAYYLEIAKKMNVEPVNCLMIGNNVQEDVQAAGAAGMSAYLLKDCLICEGELPDCPQGNYTQMMEYLSAL